MSKKCKGFTLIELMVALAISGTLLAGVSFVYMAISQSVSTSKELENAQEVLRYSSEVFTRSLKQTPERPTLIAPTTLEVEQTTVNATACDGSKPAVPFKETFSFNQADKQLLCQVNAGATSILLTGIDNIQYQILGNLVQITVTPENLNVDALAAGFQIDIALSGKILKEALK